MYRSQSLSPSENRLLIQEINNINLPVGSEILLVGDFNLPDVSWDTASVKATPETTNKQLLVQKSFLKMFQRKGLLWQLPDGTVTRRRMYNGVLQESLLDQILVSDPTIFKSFDILAAVGKSDHVGILCSMKLKNEAGYVRSEKKLWHKFSREGNIF